MQQPDPSDRNGHGTHCAGLIGARTDDDIGIRGIAPECELFNYKVAKGRKPLIEAFKAALDWAKGQDLHLLSMSLSLRKSEYETIKHIFKEIADSGIIVIAAAGENSFLTDKDGFDSFLYPAMDPNVIAVGALDRPVLRGQPTINFLPQLDVILPLVELSSTSLKNAHFYEPMVGSSQACACAVGIVALIAPQLIANGRLKPANVRTELLKIASSYEDETTFDGIKLIKPKGG